MPSAPKNHHRRSIRLPDYDYRQPGGYFVTICVQDHVCLFGEVEDGIMGLNPAGQMIHAIWNGLPRRFSRMKTDAFVVMPNHVHGIIMLTGDSNVGAPLVGARNETPVSGRAPTRDAPTGRSSAENIPPLLGNVVGAFKSITTVRYTDGVKNAGGLRFKERLWQRNYYEHVIRGRRDLERIRRYIEENPAQWGKDRYYVSD